MKHVDTLASENLVTILNKFEIMRFSSKALFYHKLSTS